MNINIRHMMVYSYPNLVWEFDSKKRTICIRSICSYLICFHRYAVELRACVRLYVSICTVIKKNTAGWPYIVAWDKGDVWSSAVQLNNPRGRLRWPSHILAAGLYCITCPIHIHHRSSDNTYYSVNNSSGHAGTATKQPEDDEVHHMHRARSSCIAPRMDQPYK